MEYLFIIRLCKLSVGDCRLVVNLQVSVSNLSLQDVAYGISVILYNTFLTQATR